MQQQTFTDTGATGTAQTGLAAADDTGRARDGLGAKPELPHRAERTPYDFGRHGRLQALPQPSRQPVRHRGRHYTGATYPAGATFPDGTFQGVPRHPINIFYNNSTEAQAIDEYNTLYVVPPARQLREHIDNDVPHHARDLRRHRQLGRDRACSRT